MLPETLCLFKANARSFKNLGTTGHGQPPEQKPAIRTVDLGRANSLGEGLHHKTMGQCVREPALAFHLEFSAPKFGRSISQARGDSECPRSKLHRQFGFLWSLSLRLRVDIEV